MHIDSSIFKSYDVRGVYPETLNEEIAQLIGKATVSTLNAKTLIVGRDMRSSSKPIFDGVVGGITEQGCSVIDIGLCSTDMLYFGTGHLQADGGIMITASHNPGKDNGLKFCQREAYPLGMGTGLEKIRDASIANQFFLPPKKGTIHQQNILNAYIQNCLSLIQPEKLKPFKIVVDAGNGMGGLTWSAVQNKLPCKTIPLFFELDGTFPNHVPNPLLPENMEFLQSEVKKSNADIGIAFDGDADRAMLVDEKGLIVSGSEVTALISQFLLKKTINTNKIILYDLRSSKIVPETIIQHGGNPLMTRVGHSHIKKLMREHDALFAGELSGHYYFRENYNADSGMMAALILLQLISEENEPLSEILSSLRKKWFHSGEINFTVQKKEQKIMELKQKYVKQGKMMEMDGLSIDFGDWWFNARPSNTEPFLRLNLEANNQRLLDEKRQELEQILNEK